MDSIKIEFDLPTHRFIASRWKTPTGVAVRDQIIACAKANKPLDEILAPYILEHPANTEPCDYPFYPPDAMEGKAFWLLSDDDLRGIHFHGENFSSTLCFAKKNLSYARFFDCSLSSADLEMSNLNHAHFERCDLSHAIFSYLTAVKTQIIDSKLQGACILGSYFYKTDLSGSDLKDVYFEDNELENLKVNYLTRFNKNLQAYWHKRCLPSKQLADIYHPIRVAYQKAELNTQADFYLMKERVANRKYILWSKFFKGKKKRWTAFKVWFKDLAWSVMAGYGIKPQRTILLGLGISLFYAVLYFFAGAPIEAAGTQSNFLGSIYFSLTTFATLGYGDLSYDQSRYFMRLLSTSESILGAVLMALFVVVLARKIIR